MIVGEVFVFFGRRMWYDVTMVCVIGTMFGTVAIVVHENGYDTYDMTILQKKLSASLVYCTKPNKKFNEQET